MLKKDDELIKPARPISDQHKQQIVVLSS